MTHITRGGDVRPATPFLSRDRYRSLPTADPPDMIAQRIATCRADITALEMAWVAACEREAGRGASRGIRLDDRATWDRPMWNRYLAAANRCEADYAPQLRRLYAELRDLEGLAVLRTLARRTPATSSQMREMSPA